MIWLNMIIETVQWFYFSESDYQSKAEDLAPEERQSSAWAAHCWLKVYLFADQLG